MLQKINVLILDDIPIFSDSLQLALQHSDLTHTVIVSDTFTAVPKLVQKHKIDLVILDLNLRSTDSSSSEVLTDLKNMCRSPKIILLSQYLEIDDYKNMISDPAVHACLNKQNMGLKEIERAIEKIMRNETYTSEITDAKNTRNRNNPIDQRLNNRDKEVLNLISSGNTRLEAASLANYSRQNIDRIMNKSFDIFKAKNVAELVGKYKKYLYFD